ncbi:MAG TPA: hypothetical protein VMX94_04145 [Armatimonadota bacterium]|nr:hypothetical protein [Armatimonadota bacterium]
MLYKRFATQILGIGVLALLICSIPAAPEPSTVSAKTKSVAVFKNGLGFFVRGGEAKLTDGWAMTEVVPAAALGTFWIGSPKPGVSIERLTALQEEVSRTVPAISIQEVLAANVGKKVRFMVGDKVIEGKLIAVPEDRKPDPNRPTYPAYTSVIPPSQPNLALIETATGTVAINKSSISWIEFDGRANVEYTAKERVKRFQFKVAGAKDKATVTMAYLQKGLSWSPAYLVELIDDKKARITMQGLLVNDVEDIEGADVYFVVGYPNFMFADTLSPLALGQSVTDFVSQLSRGGRGAPMGATTQNLAYVGFGGGYGGVPEQQATSEFGYTTRETPGAPEEDLFLYHMKEVSLRKNERAYYTVFSSEVPYEHVYEWAVPDTSNLQPSGHVESSQRTQDERLENQVWHKLRLTNNSKFPWTTAPAMATSKEQPLAQDTLNYTPKGAKGDLKLTIATDISAKKSELERTRENDALRESGYRFAKVTVDGKLMIKNFKSKPVTVTVKKKLTGEVVSASHDGKVEKQAEGVNPVNPTSLITWEVPLNPGEEKTLEYSYYAYVRY